MSGFPFDFPVELDAAGAVPTPPAVLQQQLTASVTAESPGYTNNLPGLLIEDMSSTVTAATSQCDQSRVEAINSLTPNAANLFTLTQLAQIYGTPQGQPTNTSVFVTFIGTVGFVIPQGFLVSDGTNTYALQSGGVIQSGGSSGALNAISVVAGSTFPVPEDVVTTILTGYPATVTLSVGNAGAGTPGTGLEPNYAWRARTLQAGLAACVGGFRFIMTQLCNVPGVTASNSSAVAASGGIRVIATGGDVYAIAYAIYTAIDNPSILQGSAINSGRNITVSLIDFPNTVDILFVATQTSTVTSVAYTWNTTASDFTQGGSFQGLVQGPTAAYINSLAPGQPINVFELDAIFQAATASILPTALLTRLVIAVYINSTLTPPTSGTGIIPNVDAETIFSCVPTVVTAVQG